MRWWRKLTVCSLLALSSVRLHAQVDREKIRPALEDPVGYAVAHGVPASFARSMAGLGCNGVSIKEYHDRKGTVAQAQAYASVRNASGRRALPCDDILEAQRVGASLSAVRAYAAIADPAGRPLLSGYDINVAIKSGIPLERLRAIARIADRDGNAMLREDLAVQFARRCADPGFMRRVPEQARASLSAYDISKLCEHGFPPEDILPLRFLRDAKGTLFFGDEKEFDPEMLMGYIVSGGTLRHAREFTWRMRAPDGSAMCDANALANLAGAGVDFDEAWRILHAYADENGPRLTCKQLGRIVSGKRQVLERFGRQWDGAYVWSGRALEVLAHTADPEACVRDYSDVVRNIGGVQAARYCQLGISREEAITFNDTQKPNALLIYPTNDHNWEFEKPAALDIFRKIRESYDVRVAVVDREEQKYAAIAATADIMLLIDGGHGSPRSLSYGENDLRVAAGEKSEEYLLDPSDAEYAQYLAMLAPDAVIFLNSCSNAQRIEGENLAQFVTRIAGGRTVLAVRDTFGQAEIEILQAYPFSMRVVKDVRGNMVDVTYVGNAKEPSTSVSREMP